MTALSMRMLCCITAVSSVCAQQAPPPANLTLAQAKQYALQNNPRIRSADFTTGAAASMVKEARSAFFPTVSGVATGAYAEHSTILAAGALQTSSLYTRFAPGISVSQLVTDFGRTSDLTKSAELRRQAQGSQGRTVREQVILQVEQAYFQALGGEEARKAAQAAVTNRETTLRQIRALAENSMRSTLDLRFAEVALSQAQLDLYQTENLASEAQANLVAAMGLDHAGTFTLTGEQAAAPDLAADPDPVIK
jgi:outer membrane protein